MRGRARSLQILLDTSKSNLPRAHAPFYMTAIDLIISTSPSLFRAWGVMILILAATISTGSKDIEFNQEWSSDLLSQKSQFAMTLPNEVCCDQVVSLTNGMGVIGASHASSDEIALTQLRA